MPPIPIQAVDWLNFYSPVFTGFFFLTLFIHELAKGNEARRAQFQGTSRKFLIALSISLTLTFCAQFVERLVNAPPAFRSETSHALSLILIWFSLTFIASYVDALPSSPFLATHIVFLLVEVFLAGIQHALTGSKYDFRMSVGQSVLQILTTVQLLALIILGTFPGRQASLPRTDDETQPLLRDDAESDFGSSYEGSRHSIDKCDASHLSETSTESGDDEDEDDTELREARDIKIREAGGWVGYLKSFKLFLPYFRLRTLALKLNVASMVILTILVRASNILHPYQLGVIVDRLTINHIPWLNVGLWVFFGFVSSGGVGAPAIIDVLIARVNAAIGQQIKIAGFEKIMSLSMNFHDSKESGEIIKAIEQADSLAELSHLVILTIAPAVLDVIISMWFVSHLLDFYAVHIVAAIMIAFTITTAIMSKYTAAARRLESLREREESKLFYETIGNWTTVSYFNRKIYEVQRLANVIREAAKAAVNSNDAYCLLYFLQEGAEMVGSILISLLAMYRVSIGESSIGNFVNVINYWETITFPLFMLGSSYRQVSTLMISAERLIQLLETETRVTDKPYAPSIHVTHGQVEFHDVEFAYQGRECIINKLNLTVRPGQTAAFVGETGSGKSTLLKLLMRFYDLDSGSITVDGQDVSAVTTESLRKIFGIVPQESVLFNTTILENVRYGRLDASDEDVYEACRAACIHDKIMKFPKGYASKCGERGIKLSGGERQRIAIARVILKQPRIILLDEATSAMDSQIESKIQTALSTLMKGRTAFVIAHRLSTIVDADVIFVMDAGRIVETGTHDELMQQHGRYYTLWTKQSSGRHGREIKKREED